MIRHHSSLAPLTFIVAIFLAACSGGAEPEGKTTATPSGTDGGEGAIASIPGEAFFTAYGEGAATFPSDQPGLAAGDFNGDGVDDVAAGARFADAEGRTDAGSVYVIAGAFGLSGEIDFAEGEQDLTILGATPGDGLGYSAAAGDLDGDGATDLVVGAPFADQGGADTGATYIFLGPLEAGTIDLASERADVTLTGTPGSYFGDSLATGDMDSDGTTDLLVGAPFASNSAGVPAGVVFAFRGQPDWPPELRSTGADFSLAGAEQFDELGDFVVAADINGDGADDLVATAEAADGPDNSRNTAGEVHVLYAGPGTEGAYEIADGGANLSIYGAAVNDTLGFALVAADFDGDGADDLAMSARLATPIGGRGGEGIVSVLHGGESLAVATKVIDLAAPPADITTIDGVDPGALLATSLAVSKGDKPSLVLGGSLVDLGAVDSGAVYLLPPGYPMPGAVDALARETFDGAQPSARAGANIAAGDFNGDGQPDLAIIAELAPGPGDDRPEAGRIYLVTP